jgi:SulP family sulfate permease
MISGALDRLRPSGRPIIEPSPWRTKGSGAVRVGRREVLAGLVGAFALMPESISFAVVAGLNPLVGVLTAATMAISTSLLGGRPALVSGAAGSVALVITPLVHRHGLSYLWSTLIVAGALQIAAGMGGVARLLRRLPRSVITGFVNALAILIFSAQLPNLSDVPWPTYPLTAMGLALVVLIPRWVRAVPAPLIAIIAVTAVTEVGHLQVPTLGQKGDLAHWTFPHPGFPHLPWSGQAAMTIVPYAVAVAAVGLLESLMTAQLVDEWTETSSSKARECCGQGAANIITSLFGGMGGCAMIGQTVINLRSGGRTRLSSFTAGVAILVFATLVKTQLSQVPMAALAAVMIVVAATTFDRDSIRPSTLRRASWADRIALTVTIVSTVATSDLALGVIAGALSHATTTRLRRRTSGRLSD